MKHTGYERSWNWISRWVETMANNYGGIVYEGHIKWDWGQALCREIYGPDWMREGQFFKDQLEKYPPINIINACIDWTLGGRPNWVTRYSGDD